MKYLLLLFVLVVAYVVWRNARIAENEDRAAQRRPPPKPGQPQDMVRCPVCSVHLPRSEALPGPDGQLYCCQEHRLRAGGSPP